MKNQIMVLHAAIVIIIIKETYSGSTEFLIMERALATSLWLALDGFLTVLLILELLFACASLDPQYLHFV